MTMNKGDLSIFQCLKNCEGKNFKLLPQFQLSGVVFHFQIRFLPRLANGHLGIEFGMAVIGLSYIQNIVAVNRKILFVHHNTHRYWP